MSANATTPSHMLPSHEVPTRVSKTDGPISKKNRIIQHLMHDRTTLQYLLIGHIQSISKKESKKKPAYTSPKIEISKLKPRHILAGRKRTQELRLPLHTVGSCPRRIQRRVVSQRSKMINELASNTKQKPKKATTLRFRHHAEETCNTEIGRACEHTTLHSMDKGKKKLL